MAFPTQKVVQSLTSILKSCAGFSKTLPSREHKINGPGRISPSKEWTNDLKLWEKSKADAKEIVSLTSPTATFHSVLAYPVINYELGFNGLTMKIPICDNVRLSGQTPYSIESRPLIIVLDDPKNNETTICCRGTDFTRLSEFLISLGLESAVAEFNNNSTVLLSEILKSVPTGVAPPAGRVKKAFWGSFMTSEISFKDDKGKITTVVPPLWQELIDLVAGLPSGRRIRIVSHSMGTAVATAINLAISLNNTIKPDSVITLNCGGLNTLDEDAVAWFSSVCKNPIWNLTCTTDFITRLADVWTALSVGMLPTKEYSELTKTRLKNFIYKPVGKTMFFDMIYGFKFSNLSMFVSHSMNTYCKAAEPKNYSMLYLEGETPKGACNSLTEAEQQAIMEEAYLKGLGFRYSDEW